MARFSRQYSGIMELNNNMVHVIQFSFVFLPPVLSFRPMITMLFPICWFYKVMPSNHTQSPHYINTQHNNSGIIFVFIKPEDGIEGYHEMSYLSYNIMPHHNPKVIQHQFHQSEFLRPHINNFFERENSATQSAFKLDSALGMVATCDLKVIHSRLTIQFFQSYL